jgi:hypothetical protein
VVENRKNAGIVTIVIGILISAFFLFGLGIVWLIPVWIADPGKLLEILGRLSAGEIVLLGFVAFLFPLGLFMIYRGVSIMAGWRFSDTVRAFLRETKGMHKDTNQPGIPNGKNGGPKANGES